VELTHASKLLLLQRELNALAAVDPSIQSDKTTYEDVICECKSMVLSAFLIFKLESMVDTDRYIHTDNDDNNKQHNPLSPLSIIIQNRAK